LDSALVGQAEDKHTGGKRENIKSRKSTVGFCFDGGKKRGVLTQPTPSDKTLFKKNQRRGIKSCPNTGKGVYSEKGEKEGTVILPYREKELSRCRGEGREVSNKPGARIGIKSNTNSRRQNEKGTR